MNMRYALVLRKLALTLSLFPSPFLAQSPWKTGPRAKPQQFSHPPKTLKALGEPRVLLRCWPPSPSRMELDTAGGVREGNGSSLALGRNDNFRPAHSSPTVRLRVHPRCLGKISCDFPQEGGKPLHLAGKETGAGRNKAWPPCSSCQVARSPTRIVENTSLLSLLLGGHKHPMPLPAPGFGT